MSELKASDLERGGKYNWKNQTEKLVFLQKLGVWNQFALVDDPDEKVWCEVLDKDMHMLEKTVEPVKDYVIRKHGAYYREKCSGYSTNILGAGLYTEKRAKAEERGCEEVDAIALKDLPQAELDLIKIGYEKGKAMLEALGELSVDGWISVEQQLPCFDELANYPVWMHLKNGFVCSGLWNQKNKKFLSNGYEPITSVVHWQSNLQPKPPRG